MTLRGFWALIARWRWIVIPGILIALVGGAYAFVESPKSYKVESSFLFLSPVLSAEGKSGNPFLQLGNGVSVVVDVLSVSLMDGATVRSYTEDAPDLEYTAVRDTSVQAPLMVITVEDVSKKRAFETLKSLGTELGTRLVAIQTEAQAPPDLWVTMSQLTGDPVAETNYATPLRNGVIVFAGVALLTLIAVAIAERIRVRRDARRKAVRTPAVPDGGEAAQGARASKSSRARRSTHLPEAAETPPAEQAAPESSARRRR